MSRDRNRSDANTDGLTMLSMRSALRQVSGHRLLIDRLEMAADPLWLALAAAASAVAEDRMPSV